MKKTVHITILLLLFSTNINAQFPLNMKYFCLGAGLGIAGSMLPACMVNSSPDQIQQVRPSSVALILSALWSTFGIASTRHNVHKFITLGKPLGSIKKISTLSDMERLELRRKIEKLEGLDNSVTLSSGIVLGSLATFVGAAIYRLCKPTAEPQAEEA